MLVWVDIETTGLDPRHDRILEVGLAITDDEVTTTYHVEDVLVKSTGFWDACNRMPDVVREMHSASGLLGEVAAYGLHPAGAEVLLLDWLNQYAPDAKGVTPMCGNSIGFDRSFLDAQMPTLEAWFHYRNLDVSSFKEAYRRLRPAGEQLEVPDVKPHRALEDIGASIREFQFYKRTFLRVA